MVDLATVVRLVAGVGLLLSNGFFVTTEFALTRVRQFPREEFQGRGLNRAWEMTERLEIFLSGCQVGITISSVGLGIVAEPALAAVVDPLLQSAGLATVPASGHTALAAGVAFGIASLAHVVIGEQAPTYLGIERTKFVSKYGAPLLYWWTKVMSPVILVSDWTAKAILGLFGVEISRSWAEEELDEEPTTRAELYERMGDALAGVGVSDERREEVLNAFEIGEIPVEEVMIDREDVVALSTENSTEENLELIANSPHVRFPLVGEDLEDFRGIVYTPAVLRHRDEFDDEVDWERLCAPPMTVSTDTVVSDLIDRFQTENQELALVIDDGRVVGLVTATDAFEEITGDLEDPLDARAAG